MERKQYTLEEVAKRTGENGSRCWIILWGNVYDVTDYLDQHPGGGELISEFAGTDASKGFDDFGHSSDAKKMLKKYEIGVVAKTEKSAGKADRMSRENAKQRRKFLSIILGPCASA
ncbi:hypothetical protein TSAR_003517 [Trichomalopsis sarcophagae]|uniref:Cytochrome b5 heme-binding domain-containing protein n=1 Tax=Trichomalopsis sarcophagae TaxID=543379 RepID=A0A232EFK5_9HYME|nr:hypothetical protein TSAR_003517 [Trichomalopsis sarcophagae]